MSAHPSACVKAGGQLLENQFFSSVTWIPVPTSGRQVHIASTPFPAVPSCCLPQHGFSQMNLEMETFAEQLHQVREIVTEHHGPGSSRLSFLSCSM